MPTARARRLCPDAVLVRAGLRRLPRGVARGDGARARGRSTRRGRRARRGLPRPRRAWSRRAPRCAGSIERHPRRRRAWTARSGSGPTGSSPRSPRMPRSRAASSASRASRRASASPATRRGSSRGSGRRPPRAWTEMGITTLRRAGGDAGRRRSSRASAPTTGRTCSAARASRRSAQLTPVRIAVSESRETTFDYRHRRRRRSSRRSSPTSRASSASAWPSRTGAGATSRSRCACRTSRRSRARARSRRATNDAAVVTEVALDLLREYAPARPGAPARRPRRRVRARPRRRATPTSSRCRCSVLRVPNIDIAGNDLYYERRGTGEPMLLIQGLGRQQPALGRGLPRRVGGQLRADPLRQPRRRAQRRAARAS